MPVQIQWLIKDKVVYSIFSGDNGNDEYAEWSSTLKSMIETTEGSIFLLTDLTDTAPAGSNGERVKLGELRKSFAVMKSPQIKWAVTYGKFTDQMSRFIGSTLAALIGYRLKMMKTREDAIAFILALDPTLDFDTAFAELEKEDVPENVPT